MVSSLRLRKTSLAVVEHHQVARNRRRNPSHNFSNHWFLWETLKASWNGTDCDLGFCSPHLNYWSVSRHLRSSRLSHDQHSRSGADRDRSDVLARCILRLALKFSAA